ncbi:VOC family protein [Bacillus marinisedimentorum]|uniref:VOC family protein n=1 Tax=Bacillus marinisedimentorum TaxID=1821260 RepID=UPI0007DECDE1|nr:VOC family protein [Bacillus marinisedimentorum]
MKFDHLVHFSIDPVQSMEEAGRYGIRAFFGGEHEPWGTYNTLAFFGLPYIEWIGIRDSRRTEAEQDNRLIQQVAGEQHKGDHLLTFAMRTDDINQEARKFEAKGIKTKGPLPGSRLQENGELLKWSMLFIENENENSVCPYPFFIEWGESDEKRLERLQEMKNEKIHLQAIYIAVSDQQAALAEYQSLFGLEVSGSFHSAELGAACTQVYLEGCNLIFCEPAGDGPVKEVIEQYGQVPFKVGLIKQSGEGTTTFLIGKVPYQITNRP